MMRAALVGTGTVVGVGVVLGLNPTGASTTALNVPLVPAGSPAQNGAAFGPVAPAGAGSPSAAARPTAAAPRPTPTSSSAQHAARAVPSQGPTASRTPAATGRATASPTAAPTRSAAPPPSATPKASPTRQPAPSASPTPTASSATGPAVDVGYGQFGIIQVQATVSGGRLVDIEPVQLPNYEQTSVLISEQAWPILKQEALQAQSAQIANVTGASFTTAGFEQSLRGALLALGHSA